MNRVRSKDGTSIAYERIGTGPALILVGGGLDDGSENAPLANELAKAFTVYNYARRGRGASSDTLPYAVQREIEDIDALIAETGGTTRLYGVSSGGALALEATAAGLAIDRLAVYEVPYCIADEMRQRSQWFLERLGPALASGQPGAGLDLFMRFAGSSEEDIEGAKHSSFWPGLLRIEHTLGYDAACLNDYELPTERLARIRRPTMVLTGDALDIHMAGLPRDFLTRAADAITATVPGAQRRTIKGQSHVADPRAVASILEDFFNA